MVAIAVPGRVLPCPRRRGVTLTLAPVTEDDDVTAAAAATTTMTATTATAATATTAATAATATTAAGRSAVSQEGGGGGGDGDGGGGANINPGFGLGGGGSKDVVLHLGIIDILQEYNMSKSLETTVKGAAYGRDAISSVDPVSYSRRFQRFLQRVFE